MKNNLTSRDELPINNTNIKGTFMSIINGNVIATSSDDQIYFNQYTSLHQPVVKWYKADGTKEISANIPVAEYQTMCVASLLHMDQYIQSVSQHTTMTLGVTTLLNGISQTNAAVRNGENCISRSKEFFKYYNDLYPVIPHKYCLYFFDIDYDEDAPEHFELGSVEKVQETLIRLIPALKFVGMLIKPSSSANIVNTQTGESRSGGNSWHIFIVVANSTKESNKNFTEYIRRRAWRDDVKLAYVKHTKGSASVVMRLYLDTAVTSPERIIAIAKVKVDYPYVKLDIPSTIIEGGILDLASIDAELEEDYRPKFEQAKQLLTGKSGHNRLNTANTLPTINTFLPKSHDGKIIISAEDKERVIAIYSYLQKSTKSEVSEVRKHLSQTLVAALLTFLGFSVDANFKFKMRDENTASTSVNYNGYIKDFGGTFAGDIISFIMETYKLQFIEAWHYFQNLFGKRAKLSIKTQVALPSARAFEKSLITN